MTSTQHAYIFFALNSLLIIFLSSCAKYAPTKLLSYDQAMLSTTQQKNNVELSIKAFGEETFKDHFTHFQALAIHIKNKTDHPYILQAANISLPLTTPEEVNKKAPSMYVRYFLPTIAFSLFGYLFFWEIGIPMATVFSLWGHQKSTLQNKHGLALLKEYALTPSTPLIIEPYSSKETLIFIKKTDYQPEFTISLDDPDSKKLVMFNVTIASQSHRIYKTL